MKLTMTAAVILCIHGLTSPMLLSQNVILANDVHEITCSYLACGTGDSGLEFLADDGSICALQESGLTKIDRIGLTKRNRLNSAVYIGSSAWVYSHSDDPMAYYWRQGQLLDSLTTPDQSNIIEIRSFDSTIFVRTTSGIALYTSLRTLSTGTVLSPFVVYAIAPFSQGVHVIGLDSIYTYAYAGGSYSAAMRSSASFASPPLSSVSTSDGNHLLTMTIRLDKVYCLYKSSRDSQPILVDTSLHPFALSSKGNSISAVSIDGIRTYTSSAMVFASLPLTDLEVFEYLPLTTFATDTSVTIAGAHSFIADLSYSGGWNITSYLPQKRGSGLTILAEGDQVGAISGLGRRSVVIQGRTIHEWKPLPIRGSCVNSRDGVANQAFIGQGELMTTWYTAVPNITFSRGRFETVWCSNSVTRPDLWTENGDGALFGIASVATDSFIQKSTDRGRTWSRFCPSQGPNNLVDFIVARGDSIWIYGSGLGRTTLDTAVYRTQSHLRIRQFVDGIPTADTSLYDIAGVISPHLRGERVHAIVRSNLVATGPIRSLGYFDLPNLSFSSLFADESIRLNSFAFIGASTLCTDLSGNIYSFRMEQADTTMTLVSKDLEFPTIEELGALDDTTALLITATTPPSVYIISVRSPITSIDVVDPYQNLRIASIKDVFPNPSTSNIRMTLTVANGWPIGDVTITATSVMGLSVFGQPLTSLTSTISNGATIEIELPCNTWPAGAYVLSARSSRGLDSRVVIKY